MEKLNFKDLCLLCDVTKERIVRVNERIVRVNELINSFSILDGKNEERIALSLELVETYQAEKLELEALFEKLQILKLEA